MKPEDLIETALQLCIDAHGGQFDDDGQSKFIHIFSVCAPAQNPEELIVALLHDSVEDNPIVTFDLLQRLFGSELADAIKILTRRKHQTYTEYIDELIASKNTLAMQVKIYDLNHNLSRNTKGKKYEDRWKDARKKILTALSSPTSFSIPISHGDIITS